MAVYCKHCNHISVMPGDLLCSCGLETQLVFMLYVAALQAQKTREHAYLRSRMEWRGHLYKTREWLVERNFAP